MEALTRMKYSATTYPAMNFCVNFKDEQAVKKAYDVSNRRSSFAYRFAACLLILNVLMNVAGFLVAAATLSIPILIGSVVDFISAIGLFRLRSWARSLTFARAFLGAIIVPMWLFLVVFNANILSTLLVSAAQWGTAVHLFCC